MGCVEGRPGSHRPRGMERGEVDEHARPQPLYDPCSKAMERLGHAVQLGS